MVQLLSFTVSSAEKPSCHITGVSWHLSLYLILLVLVLKLIIFWGGIDGGIWQCQVLGSGFCNHIRNVMVVVLSLCEFNDDDSAHFVVNAFTQGICKMKCVVLV